MSKLKWCPERHKEYCIAGEISIEYEGAYLVTEKEIKDETTAWEFNFCPLCGKSFKGK